MGSVVDGTEPVSFVGVHLDFVVRGRDVGNFGIDRSAIVLTHSVDENSVRVRCRVRRCRSGKPARCTSKTIEDDVRRVVPRNERNEIQDL